MKDFCIQFSFAATFSSAVVMLAVALWNEGCNQQVSPNTIVYQGEKVAPLVKSDQEVMSIGSGNIERPALFIIPPSLSPEPKP